MPEGYDEKPNVLKHCIYPSLLPLYPLSQQKEEQRAQVKHMME